MRSIPRPTCTFVLALATAAALARPPPAALPPSPVSERSRVPELTLLGEPEITRFTPSDFAVQGGDIFLTGTLKASLLRAAIGDVALQIVSSSPTGTSATSVRLGVPVSLTTTGAPLVVWYGVNGPRRQLAPSFPVIPRARVIATRILAGPFLKFDHRNDRMTRIEVEVADFVATADSKRPALFAPGCANAGTTAIEEVSGPTHRLRFDFGFYAEQAGRRCRLELRPYGSRQAPIPAGEVQIPALATYTIAETADLLAHTTPSGRRLAATARKGPIACQLGSIGSAGTFPTGVVTVGGDLSFQLRNGLLQEDCVFETSAVLEVHEDWRLAAARWEFTRDAFCTATEGATQHPSGATVSYFFDGRALFPVRFEASCRPDPTDPARNAHVYAARLASVELLGPPGRRWQDAFR